MSDTGYLGHSQADWDALARNTPGYLGKTQAEWDALTANMTANPDPLGWGAIAKAMGPNGVKTDPAKEAQQNATYADLAKMLDNAGLGSLFKLNPDGSPDTTSWLWKELIANPSETTFDSLGPHLENTPVFQQRFPVIEQIRKNNKTDPEHAHAVPTATDVINYETAVRADMTKAGLPSSMTSNSYIQDLMGKGLNQPEIRDRLGQAYTRVADTDPAVLKAYQDFYGVIDAPGALAASFLDPEHMQANLDKQSLSAYTYGMGQKAGVNMSRATAEAVGQLPKSETGIIQDIQSVSGINGVFNESLGETKDLTTDTGIQAVSLGDGQAKNDIERRILERQANAKTSTGGAFTTNAGITGAGIS